MIRFLDFEPGQEITLHKRSFDAPWTRLEVMATVLVVTPHFLICNGNYRQGDMAPWVQSVCKEAGLSEDQKVQLAYPGDLLNSRW